MNKLNTKLVRSDLLYRLMNSSHSKVINRMISNGDSLAKITKWLNSENFEISKNSVARYMQAYKQSVASKVSLKAFIVPATALSVEDIKKLIEEKEEVTEVIHKAKNDREILDKILEKGFNNLHAMPDSKISIDIMFQTIKLKEQIANHNTLYGEEIYQELELGKYAAIISEILKFIPDKQKTQVIERIRQVEEDYYREKGYYREYLESKQNQALITLRGDSDD